MVTFSWMRHKQAAGTSCVNERSTERHGAHVSDVGVRDLKMHKRITQVELRGIITARRKTTHNDNILGTNYPNTRSKVRAHANSKKKLNNKYVWRDKHEIFFRSASREAQQERVKRERRKQKTKTKPRVSRIRSVRICGSDTQTLG